MFHARARTRFVSIVLPPTVAAIAVACSLTTSLDGLSGGAEATDGGRSDGGGSDATAGDGGGATDGAVAVDGGPDGAFRCIDHPGVVFCADFETDPFDLGWDEHVTTSGSGTFAAVPARTSRGLQGSIPARAAGNTRGSAALGNTLVMAAATNFTISLDVLLGPNLASAGVIDFGGFGYRSTFYTAYLRAANGTFEMREYGDPTGTLPGLSRGQPMLRGPMPGVWAHITTHVTFASGSSHALVQMDGQTIFDGEIGAFQYASDPHVYAGISNAEDQGAAFNIVIDDVLVTTP